MDLSIKRDYRRENYMAASQFLILRKNYCRFKLRIFFAWWARVAYRDKKTEQIFRDDDYGLWRGKRHIDKLIFEADEDIITRMLMMHVQEEAGPDWIVRDHKSIF